MTRLISSLDFCGSFFLTPLIIVVFDQLIEAVVLPMTHKERFEALGIQPPKGTCTCMSKQLIRHDIQLIRQNIQLIRHDIQLIRHDIQLIRHTCSSVMFLRFWIDGYWQTV